MEIDPYLYSWKKDPPVYRVTESGYHQIFLPYTEVSHPPQNRYNCPMPAPDILEWLNDHGLNYWAMGYPVFDRPDMFRGFRGSGFNFKDLDMALLFKLTWIGF